MNGSAASIKKIVEDLNAAQLDGQNGELSWLAGIEPERTGKEDSRGCVTIPVTACRARSYCARGGRGDDSDDFRSKEVGRGGGFGGGIAPMSSSEVPSLPPRPNDAMTFVSFSPVPSFGSVPYAP
jgi:hypothetical protein